MVGQTISHYRVISKLGEGGMGIVYLAEDIDLGRRVAIKTAKCKPDDYAFLNRFLREARAASILSHQHIATIYDYGKTEDGQPYMVMELVEGQTLSELMRAGGLTISQTLKIISQVAEALSEAHRHRIVHRDIKPSNIVINERGMVKVLDFGLAKQINGEQIDSSDPENIRMLNTQTREGTIVGTPLYLSPEQALGLKVDERSDLFSLGSVLYECVAGQPPFGGSSPIEITAKVIRDDPLLPSTLNPSVSGELDRVTLKALAKKVQDRYQTADEVIGELSALQLTCEVGTTTTPPNDLPADKHNTNPFTMWAEVLRIRRPWIRYVVAVLVLLTAATFIIAYWNRSTLPRPRPEAEQLYENGLVALREGSYFKASNLFGRAVTIESKFALARARWAEALVELDRSDKAKDEMLSASRLVADAKALDRTHALYFEAIQATLTRDLSGAIKAYEEILRLHPGDASSYLDLGRAYENHDETEKAIEQYSKASTLDPTNPASFLRLGTLHGRRQDWIKSNGAFDKAESIYHDNVNFEGSSEVFYQRAYLLSQSGKMVEAHNFAQRSLDVARTSGNLYQQVRALLLLGTVAYSTGDTKFAENLITQAIDLARSNDLEQLTTQGIIDLGYALMIKRSYGDSEKYLKQGFDLAQRDNQKRNEARANLLLGTLYIQQEDADKGAPYIDKALTFYRNGGYRRELSRCMMMVGRKELLKGDFESALKTLDEQLQLARQVEDIGQLARSQQELAASLSKQSFYPQALNRFTESYQIYKSLDNSFQAAFGLINRIDMLAQLGQIDQATLELNELKSYIDKLPQDNNYREIWTAWSYIIRGRIALSQEDYNQAIRNGRSALSILTNKNSISIASAKALVGIAQLRTGSVNEARRTCREALNIALSSGDARTIAETRLALAEALYEAGDATSALENALQAQEALSRLHLIEPEWRAWLIAALASHRRKSSLDAIDKTNHSKTVLEQLKVKWGNASFDAYRARADIKRKEQQLSEMLIGKMNTSPYFVVPNHDF